METEHYVMVKIPRQPEGTPHAKRESFADLVGVLKDVAMFKGKSSVEVQHMIKNVWRGQKEEL